MERSIISSVRILLEGMENCVGEVAASAAGVAPVQTALVVWRLENPIRLRMPRQGRP